MSTNKTEMNHGSAINNTTNSPRHLIPVVVVQPPHSADRLYSVLAVSLTSTDHVVGGPTPSVVDVPVHAEQPDVHNSLPDELRNSESFDNFKRFMKTILFSRY